MELVREIEVAQLRKKGLKIDLENLELTAQVNGMKKIWRRKRLQKQLWILLTW